MPVPDLASVHVRLVGTEEEVRAFLVAHSVEGHVKLLDNGRVAFEALVPGQALMDAKRFKLTAEPVEDIVTNARLRQQEVGKGNRFAEGQLPPGLGVKTPR